MSSSDGLHKAISAEENHNETISSDTPEGASHQTNESVYFELEKEDSQLNQEAMETERAASTEKQGKHKKAKSERKKRNSFINTLKGALNMDKSSEGKSEGKGGGKSYSGDTTDAMHSDQKATKRTSTGEGHSTTQTDTCGPPAAESDKFPVYELAKEIEKQPAVHKHQKVSTKTDSLRSTISLGNRGCQEGVGAPVPVNFINPPQQMNAPEDEYSKAFIKSTETPLNDSDVDKLKAKGFDNLDQTNNSSEGAKEAGQQSDDCCPTESEGEAFDWGSEFDDEDNDDPVYNQPNTSTGDKEESIYEKPLPKTPKNKAPGLQGFLNRKISSPSENFKFEAEETLMTTCLPVTINPEKHPPPYLPPEPDNLTDNQRKRRIIIDLIIQSEQSYLESLERILKDYERPVLEFIPNPKSKLKHVFAQTRDIISHHRMFQIELSEIARKWDQEEKIGYTFAASFSKSMLVDSYSVYVNNFAAAMEEIRTLRRHKASFDDFLKNQETLGIDRLSIFGLMVKPVQRFPQFMMFLQDLIKYTPCKHHDRQALQLALTELESIAYKLNERKRQSEQEFQAQQIVQKLVKQKVQHMLTSLNFSSDVKRRAMRSDMMEQISGEGSNTKCKNRRVILMNDRLLCVKVIEKEQSGFVVERLALRWFANLGDLELKDTAITPAMLSVVKKDNEKVDIISLHLEPPEEDPYHLYADLKEMLHDYNILGQISGLLASLKRSYAGHGLNEELIHEVSRDLQRMIQLKDEQLRLVNSCSIVLEDTSKSDKPHYVLQTQSAAMKQEWCVDFLMAKLAVDKSNMSAWDSSLSSDLVSDSIPAVFLRHLPVDVPRTYTKIKCAVSIFLNPENSPLGVGIQHLWVCSSNDKLGQISLLSIHNSKPSLMESFKACGCEITSVELVPGCGGSTVPGSYQFAEDTVWMSTFTKEILIFPLTSTDGAHRNVISSIKLSATALSLMFVDERFFCGCDNGTLVVYSRSEAGHWETLTSSVMKLGQGEAKIHFVHEEDLYVSCGNQLYILEIDSLQQKAKHVLMAANQSSIHTVVKSGMGIWVSFKDSSVIKLFHIESMETLQELSIGNFVNRIRTERLWSLSGATENMVVTCLAISKGLLWIGTSTGLILTVPLPRLSDGVPLYRGNPNISLHAHKGPVKFLIVLNCSTSTLELNGASSLRAMIRSRPSKRNIQRERVENLLNEQGKSSDYAEVKDISQATSNADEDFDSLKRFSIERTVSERSNTPSLLTDGEAEAIMIWEEQQELGVEAETTMRRNRKTVFEESSVGLQRTSKYVKKRNSKHQSSISELTDQSDLRQTGKPHEIEMLYEVLMENSMEQTEDGKNLDPGHFAALSSTPDIYSKASSFQSSASPISPSSDSACLANSSGEGTNLASPAMEKGLALHRNMSRKGNNNAVIVLSGGDGYCDLDYSRNQAKNDCASVLLWIYKY